VYASSDVRRESVLIEADSTASQSTMNVLRGLPSGNSSVTLTPKASARWSSRISVIEATLVSILQTALRVMSSPVT